MPRALFIIINLELIPIFKVGIFLIDDSKIIKLWFWKIFNLAKAGADPDDKGMMSMKWISELENNLGEI